MMRLAAAVAALLLSGVVLGAEGDLGAQLVAVSDGAVPAPIIRDWLAQDGTLSAAAPEERLTAFLREREAQRRALIEPYSEMLRRVVFTKHFDMGGSHYAYTEAQSDGQHERNFEPGSALCLLELDGLYGSARELLSDAGGVIRDPDVSHDGERILFAWKKSLDGDDYHLYEMDAATAEVRQITESLGFADYEGQYLPNGDIVFNSTRCVQIVDCWWTEVSNLYTCGPDGSFLRRLSFDQVHTNFPTVTPDGRVIYTRWDYNDRGQIYPQGLFEMHPDGTGQTELYGNNSWFPTAILHTRAIPGDGRYVTVFSGHHTKQQGWLGTIDPRLGRQENTGAQLIAPIRATPAERIDAYGQAGDQFQYPYPLSANTFLVAMRPEGAARFAIYLVTADGRRELLAWDEGISCNQPIPLAPRPVPPRRSNIVDYAQDDAVVYLQDIYGGPGLSGIARGAITELRVVAIDFRAAGVGSNKNSGPAGAALASTPVSVEGAWDVKTVLGTTPVHDDGSACFRIPARTPVYFQALDGKGHAVQTMRSWMTCQPGERVSCVGCHEGKNTTPPMSAPTEASLAEPAALVPPEWGVRGFSFVREIQPILDRHCVSCHCEGDKAAEDPMQLPQIARTGGVEWRYTEEQPPTGWERPEFNDSGWRVGLGGFGREGTPESQVGTEWHSSAIWLRRTFTLEDAPHRAKLLIHHDEDLAVYTNGHLALERPGFVQAYYVQDMTWEAAESLVAGENTLAVSCRQTSGAQYVDVGIVECGLVSAAPGAAFSLTGEQRFEPTSLRKWSDGYRNLADRRWANWINTQSEPSMLPPYHAGAARSWLIAMLEAGHFDVELAPEEVYRLATWIDLLVPYCGDYREGLEGDNLARYEHFLAKREREAEAEERRLSELR